MEIPIQGPTIFNDEKSLSITCTYITENYDLYVVQETQYRYILSSINLHHDKKEKEKKYHVVQLFDYKKDDIHKLKNHDHSKTMRSARMARKQSVMEPEEKIFGSTRLFDIHVRTASI